MKQYRAVFKRENPQLKSGGYETTRIIEARTLTSATRKTHDIEKKCVYGCMTLIYITEKK